MLTLKINAEGYMPFDEDTKLRFAILEQIAIMNKSTDQLHPDMLKAQLDTAYEFVTRPVKDRQEQWKAQNRKS